MANLPDVLAHKLTTFGKIVDELMPIPAGQEETIGKYRELSTRQTTHVTRRTDRQAKFIEAINAL